MILHLWNSEKMLLCQAEGLTESRHDRVLHIYCTRAVTFVDQQNVEPRASSFKTMMLCENVFSDR